MSARSEEGREKRERAGRTRSGITSETHSLHMRRVRVNMRVKVRVRVRVRVRVKEG